MSEATFVRWSVRIVALLLDFAYVWIAFQLLAGVEIWRILVVLALGVFTNTFSLRSHDNSKEADK